MKDIYLNKPEIYTEILKTLLEKEKHIGYTLFLIDNLVRNYMSSNRDRLFFHWIFEIISKIEFHDIYKNKFPEVIKDLKKIIIDYFEVNGNNDPLIKEISTFINEEIN